MKKINILRIVLLLLILVWAYSVFSFSGQDGTESSGVSRKLVGIFIKDENLIDEIEPYVRKVAHFSEYGLGGVLFISLFSTYDWTDRKKMVISIGLGVWYASIDEIHQLLVPGRHGGLEDVWIDSLGVATGVVAMLIVIKLVNIIQNGKHSDINKVEK